MRRTKPQRFMKYDLTNEPIILSKGLIDLLLKQKNASDLIALYTFYYYTAKWQKTNIPKSTTSYTANGIGWGEQKVKKIKSKLIKLGLIENHIDKLENGIIIGHYIKINFIWSDEKVQRYEKPPGGKSHRWRNQPINALSTNSINALSTNNKKNIFPPTKKNNKKSIQERNLKYIPIAEKLSKIICQNKNMLHTSIQIKSWANDIRQLEENNGIDFSRIKNALDWYNDHIGEQYCPVIESGNSLRAKFTKLESAIERENYNYKFDKRKQEEQYYKDYGSDELDETLKKAMR
jgi:hypothetical protein